MKAKVNEKHIAEELGAPTKVEPAVQQHVV
jgi:hypothetical protein